MNKCRIRSVKVNARGSGRMQLLRSGVILAHTFLLLPVLCYADSGVASPSDPVPVQITGSSSVNATTQEPKRSSEQQPALGNNRLFISSEQRRLVDTSNDIEASPPEGLAPVNIEPEVIQQPFIKKLVKPRNRVLTLDGLILRPDGSVDVWINGSLIGSHSNNGIKLVWATASGPVVLQVQGQRYALYPGQRQFVSLASGG